MKKLKLGIVDKTSAAENKFENLVGDDQMKKKLNDGAVIKKSRIEEAENAQEVAEFKREEKIRERIHESLSEVASISISVDNTISALPPLPSGR